MKQSDHYTKLEVTYNFCNTLPRLDPTLSPVHAPNTPPRQLQFSLPCLTYGELRIERHREYRVKIRVGRAKNTRQEGTKTHQTSQSCTLNRHYPLPSPLRRYSSTPLLRQSSPTSRHLLPQFSWTINFPSKQGTREQLARTIFRSIHISCKIPRHR